MQADLPTHAFPSAASFEAFLECEHTTAPGIYLKFAKKASDIPSITGAEAVEVALCFGWIDGRANSIDENWWTVRYTPRRAKSIWSQKNVGIVSKLIEEGRMRPAGLAAVEAAKSDGRWERAYAGPATMTIPDDFTVALDTTPTAKAYFDSLKKSERYTVLWNLAIASEKNRELKIDALISSLAIGKLPGSKKVAAREVKSRGSSKIKSVRRASPLVKLEENIIHEPDSQLRRAGLRRRK